MRGVVSLTILCLFGSAAFAGNGEVTLLCKGTHWYHVPSLPNKAEASIVVRVNEKAKTLEVTGSLSANGKGSLLSMEDTWFRSYIEKPIVVDGERYPYLMVSLNRYDGSVLVMSIHRAPLADGDEPLSHFSGTCERKQKLVLRETPLFL
jgi:hypothetical protein